MIIQAMACVASFTAGAACTAYAIFWFFRSLDRDDAEFTDRVQKANQHYD